jgi:pimeloyl-ACP methyl ester carboxylesterase
LIGIKWRMGRPGIRHERLHLRPLRLPAILACAALAGCSLSPSYELDPQPLDAGRLPEPDRAVRIAQLEPCTDSADHTLRFNSAHPITILVHGCRGSAGRFRALAQLHAFHGQQAFCFAYDAGDSLVRSASRLATAIDALAPHMQSREVTIIGHSMGGLVARKAMEDAPRRPGQRDDVVVNLVTVSAPIAGIAAASPCGYRSLHWLSLGLVPAVCRAITGDNWHEITASSEFIREPGPLGSSVRQYLKVVTNERDTCRARSASGACLESDFIFTLPEQYHPVVDAYPRVTNVEVDAGHVEIVGYKDVAPRKLLAILQRQGMLAPTPPQRRSELERLLTRLY